MTSRTLELLHLDFDPPSGLPSTWRLVLATVVSLVGSVLANMALATVGRHLFPSTRTFSHFRFDDYATLTVIGVLAACAAWPIVARATSRPRWLFFRTAVVVTLVLWLPDLWLLGRGESVPGVLVLMVMHLAVALVTYNALVHLAPAGEPHPERSPDPEVASWDAEGTASAPITPGSGRSRSATGADRPGTVGSGDPLERTGLWAVMLGLVGLELLLGIWTLVSVPAGRPDSFVPRHGAAVYEVHVAIGVLLGLAAASLVVASLNSGRDVRLAARVGFVGVALGGLGGLIVADHQLRVFGMCVMFGGVAIAAMGYLLGVVLIAPRDDGVAGSDDPARRGGVVRLPANAPVMGVGVTRVWDDPEPRRLGPTRAWEDPPGSVPSRS